MPRGGKRDGAGRTPQHWRYDKHKPFYGKRALLIGQRCQILWLEEYPTNRNGFHWIGDKRPHGARKRIKHRVAVEFGEKESMVELFWRDYRKFEADGV